MVSKQSFRPEKSGLLPKWQSFFSRLYGYHFDARYPLSTVTPRAAQYDCTVFCQTGTITPILTFSSFLTLLSTFSHTPFSSKTQKIKILCSHITEPYHTNTHNTSIYALATVNPFKKIKNSFFCTTSPTTKLREHLHKPTNPFYRTPPKHLYPDNGRSSSAQIYHTNTTIVNSSPSGVPNLLFPFNNNSSYGCGEHSFHNDKHEPHHLDSHPPIIHQAMVIYTQHVEFPSWQEVAAALTCPNLQPISVNSKQIPPSRHAQLRKVIQFPHLGVNDSVQQTLSPYHSIACVMTDGHSLPPLQQNTNNTVHK